MILYSLRHEQAVDRESGRVYPNDDRPLSQDGRVRIRKTAPVIAKLVEPLTEIWSSPLKRASQTAQPVAAAMDKKIAIRTVDELLPEGSVASILRLIGDRKSKKQILLVGHEPSLSAVVSFVIKSSPGTIEIKKELSANSILKTVYYVGY